MAAAPAVAWGSRATRQISTRLLLGDLAPVAVWAILWPAHGPVLLAFAGGWVSVMSWLDRYRRRFHESIIDDLAVLALALGAGLGLAGVMGLQVGTNATPDLSALGLSAAGGAMFTRSMSYRIERLQRRRMRHVERMVIVGAGETTAEIVRRANEHPELGLYPIGVIDDADQHTAVATLGTLDDLELVARRYRATTVLIAFPQVSESRLVEILRSGTVRDLEVYSVPPCFAMMTRLAPGQDSIWGIPVQRLSSSPLSRGHLGLKRLLDVVLAGLALVLVSPLLLAVALAVRLELGPGVIFRQERVGRGGEPITVLKFRSMRTEVAQSATTWSVAADRIGPVGRFIRATSIDELPQLLNVLRGDMSLVGPRPERPHFVRRFEQSIPTYAHRHRLRVGMTGYAAVHGLRGDTSIAERAFFDNIYIDNWSLWLDVKIILRTIASVLGRRGV